MKAGAHYRPVCFPFEKRPIWRASTETISTTLCETAPCAIRGTMAAEKFRPQRCANSSSGCAPGRAAMPNKQNKTGRSVGSDKDFFISLPFPMTKSAAWISLGGNSVRLLIVICHHYRGKMTGPISLSIRQACIALGIARETAQKSFDDLVEKGFLRLVKKGDFVRGHGSTFFLTWREHRTRNRTREEIASNRDDAPVVVPTNTWRDWIAPPSIDKPRRPYGSTKLSMPPAPRPAAALLN